MHCFLIRRNNELQHLPGFSLIVSGEASDDADGPNGACLLQRKKRAQFVCPHPTTGLPLSFPVVDEEATVRVCSGRMMKGGDADFVLAGIVTDEYEAPCRDQALEGIRAAVAAIPEMIAVPERAPRRRGD